MNKKTQKTSAEAQKAPAKEDGVEKAITELCVAEINKILAEHNRTLQTVLEGYPFSLTPSVRVVPIRGQRETQNAETEKE